MLDRPDFLPSARDAWLAVAAAALAWIATAALATGALSAGWIDRRDGDLARRKPRRAPVPLVGGFALALALALTEPWSGEAPLPWLALVGALALGALDDRAPGGLSAAAKLAGQVAVALVLAAELRAGPRPIATALVALVAMNAVNTWDNADGAAPGLVLAALLPSRAAWAMLGFLPHNLTLVERAGERVPRAYLGDAGSHLAGVLCALEPRAWPVLAVPLADLLRLARARLRAGRAPWQGDRAHLAHRLQASGRGPRATAAILLGLALMPRLVARALEPAPAGPWVAAAAGAAGVLALVALTRERRPTAG